MKNVLPLIYFALVLPHIAVASSHQVVNCPVTISSMDTGEAVVGEDG